MRTLEKAQTIFNLGPKEALGDVLGLAAMALMIFGGFLVPAFV